MIDDFKLKPGQVAPGFTPGWSAPEQVLGGAVSEASDVYAAGRMIVELLGATLVGEVRKFKLANQRGRQEEFDVFYNPSVRRILDESIVSGEGLRAWGDLARRCLRFEASERPQKMQLVVDQLRKLSAKYPLKGVSRFTWKHQVIAASFPDGSVRIARVISAEMAEKPGMSPAGT